MTAHFIRHVTLNTGHVRDSYPAEVSADALAVGRGLLDQLAATPLATVPIPLVPGYGLRVRLALTRCLAVTVWGNGPRPQHIATIGLARHNVCGTQLWRNLHEWSQAPLVTDPARPVPKPWVAATLEAPLGYHPDAARWLGDFERVLAWAFVKRRAMPGSAGPA